MTGFQERFDRRMVLILLLPVLFLATFVVLPLLFILMYSFWRMDPITRLMAPAFSWHNYQRFFSSTLYVRVLWNSAKIAGISTMVALLISYPVAYWLGRYISRKWQATFLLLIIIPFWTSYLIRTYSWIGILQNQGFLDSVLQMLGIISTPTGLLYTTTAVIIGFVHVFLPLMLLPIYAAVRNLEPSYIEAAQDLGASPIRTFFRITLPLTLTGVLSGVLLFFIPTFGAFVTPQLLGNVESTMIGNVIATQFGEAFNWPFGSALSLIVVVVVIGALLLFNRFVALESLYGKG